MTDEDFKVFLLKSGKASRSADSIVREKNFFVEYLEKNKNGKSIDLTTETDVEDFVLFAKESIKSTLLNRIIWALKHYFSFTSNKDLNLVAKEFDGKLALEKYHLRDFMGVNKDYTSILSKSNIRTAKHLLDAGRTEEDRRKLSRDLDIPNEIILELVKLSDLARIGGLRKKRARLFYGAGYDTLEKISNSNPDKLLIKLAEFVKETNFEGKAPVLSEIKHTVEMAKYLPRIIDY